MKKILLSSFSTGLASAELTYVSLENHSFEVYTLETYESVISKDLCSNFQVVTFKDEFDAKDSFRNFVKKYI